MFTGISERETFETENNVSWCCIFKKKVWLCQRGLNCVRRMRRRRVGGNLTPPFRLSSYVRVRVCVHTYESVAANCKPSSDDDCAHTHTHAHTH